MKFALSLLVTLLLSAPIALADDNPPAPDCPKGQKRFSCEGIEGAQRDHFCAKKAAKKAIKGRCLASENAAASPKKKGHHKATAKKEKEKSAKKSDKKKAVKKAPPAPKKEEAPAEELPPADEEVVVPSDEPIEGLDDEPLGE